MLKLKVTRKDGSVVEVTTTKSRLRLTIGRKAKPPVPVVVERTAVLLVPVPVRETIFVAPAPAPTAEEVAEAVASRILRELNGLERLRRDLQQPEEETPSGDGRYDGRQYRHSE